MDKEQLLIFQVIAYVVKPASEITGDTALSVEDNCVYTDNDVDVFASNLRWPFPSLKYKLSTAEVPYLPGVILTIPAAPPAFNVAL